MDLVDAALRCKKVNSRYAYIAPHYNQAKDVAWSYLKQYTAPLPGITQNESELRITLPSNGAMLRLYGADNYDRMRGVYFDGVILDEFADMDPRAWSEVIRPALSDRKGWATFIGTPKGKNAFQEIWSQAEKDDDWFTLMLKSSETGLVDDEELSDARKAMSPEQFEQEYECSFDASVVGAYYGRDMAQAVTDGRIRSVPWEPNEPVYTAWDLGLDDATAIWFAQVIGSEIRLIDYYETNNTPLRDIPRVLMNEKPYTYAEHYLPHDVEIRELMSGLSRRSSLESLGLRPIVVAQKASIEDGINAVRAVLPKCYFDEAKCNRGIDCLKQYQREWDEKYKVFRQRPLHDWSSHGADAFRYLATMLQPKAQPVEWSFGSRRPWQSDSWMGV